MTKYNNGHPRQEYRRARRCSSGTTGAILGAALAAGCLVVRSAAEAITIGQAQQVMIGAVGGALAGRAIERNRCR